MFGGDDSVITDEELKHSLVQFNVYYNEMSFHRYSESEKTSMVDLVSSIGGTLGLFLGMSFLSFIELLDLIIQIIFVLASKSNK